MFKKFINKIFRREDEAQNRDVVRIDLSEIGKGETFPEKKAVIDVWTIGHFASGIILGEILPGRIRPAAVHAAFEAFEVILDNKGFKRFHEPIDNKLMDQLAAQLGIEVAKRFPILNKEEE